METEQHQLFQFKFNRRVTLELFQLELQEFTAHYIDFLFLFPKTEYGFR